MWIGSNQPQEEEVFTSRTLYQGQGQGQGSKVETSSIACCFGGMLLAQIKHFWKSKYSEYEYFVQTFQEQSSMSGIYISEPVHWKWKKKKVGLSSIVKTKFASTSSCAIPKCQSCELARARQRSPKI
jgi:hypothetical protein